MRSLLLFSVTILIVGCVGTENAFPLPAKASPDHTARGEWFDAVYHHADIHENCFPTIPGAWRCLPSEYDNVPPYYMLTSSDSTFYFVLASDIYWLIDPEDSRIWLLWSVVLRNAMPNYLFNEYGTIDPEAYEEWRLTSLWQNADYPITTLPWWKEPGLEEWLDSFYGDTPGYEGPPSDGYEWDCRHRGRHTHANHPCLD